MRGRPLILTLIAAFAPVLFGCSDDAAGPRHTRSLPSELIGNWVYIDETMDVTTGNVFSARITSEFDVDPLHVEWSTGRIMEGPGDSRTRIIDFDWAKNTLTLEHETLPGMLPSTKYTASYPYEVSENSLRFVGEETWWGVRTNVDYRRVRIGDPAVDPVVSELRVNVTDDDGTYMYSNDDIANRPTATAYYARRQTEPLEILGIHSWNRALGSVGISIDNPTGVGTYVIGASIYVCLHDPWPPGSDVGPPGWCAVGGTVTIDVFDPENHRCAGTFQANLENHLGEKKSLTGGVFDVYLQ